MIHDYRIFKMPPSSLVFAITNPTGELDHWTRFKQGVRNKKAGDFYSKSNLRRSKLFGMYIVSRSNIISDYSNVKVVFSVVIADILHDFT